MDGDVRSRIGAAVQRVDAVLVSADVGRVLVHWLGQLAEVTVQRNGCAPAGLVEVQGALAEAVAAVGDSRVREPCDVLASEVLALGQEPVVNVGDAARMLDLKPDTVRLMCRRGKLGAKKVAGRWFPAVAAVQNQLRRRVERSA